MSDAPQDSLIPATLGTEAALNNAFAYVGAQAVVLHATLPVVLGASGARWLAVASLVDAIDDSCTSLMTLSTKRKSRDCYVLARTIFETIVNTLFILAKGEAAAEKALRHSKQKAYRDLSRRLTINDIEVRLAWTGSVDLGSDQKLKDALAEFTNAKGREVTSWTPETLSEQMSVIDSHYKGKYGGVLAIAFLVIYRHASEIAHGTVFSAFFSYGFYGPGRPKSAEAYEQHKMTMVTSLQHLVGHCVSLVTQAIGVELPVKELSSKSKEMMTRANELLLTPAPPPGGSSYNMTLKDVEQSGI